MMKNNLSIQLAVTTFIIGAIVISVWFTPIIDTTEQTEIAQPVQRVERNVLKNESKPIDAAIARERIVNVSHVTQAANAFEVLTGITIVGVEASINMHSAAVMKREVAMLWQKFKEKEALHQNVNWVSEPKIYAHYHDFNRTVTKAVLSIGYSLNVLQLASLESKGFIPSNKYQVKRNVSESELMLQWQSVNYPVSDVVERYTLNSSGDIKQIDFLYAQ